MSKETTLEVRSELQPIHLLWTGGWDSTYRLLELLLILNKKVQPYYVIDPDRESVGYELKAMQNIKKTLEEEYPEQRKLLMPTNFVEMGDIASNEQINRAYHRLIKKHPHLGIQNEWLARLTFQFGLSDMEIGLQKSTGRNFGAVKDLLKKFKSDGYLRAKIPDRLKGSDEYLVFGSFSFPLFNITKSGMLEKSKNFGFFKLMENTWFCHHPLLSGKPCGVCVPCSGVIRDGLSFRLPLYSRVRYHFRVFLSKDQLEKNYPEIYRWLKNIKLRVIGKHE